jgi:hypothetical protein
VGEKIKPGQIRNLTAAAQQHIQKLYDILQAGGSVTNTDAGMLGVSFLAMRELDIAEVFRINQRTVRRWSAENGCPRRPDGLYELLAVIDWYAKRNSNPDEMPTTLSASKTTAEINLLRLKEEKLELELDAARAASVPTDVHQRVITALIESFTTYLRNSMMRNVAMIRAVPDAELEPLVNDFIIALTKQMASAATRAERV